MNKMIIDISALSDDDKQILICCIPYLIYLKSIGMLKNSTTDMILKDINEFVYLKTINRKDY